MNFILKGTQMPSMLVNNVTPNVFFDALHASNHGLQFLSFLTYSRFLL